MKKFLISFGWMLLGGVMLVRSGIHAVRILTETQKSYYPQIDGCRINFDWNKDDMRILYLYRNLGKICEK